MRDSYFFRSLIGLSLFGLGLATGLVAQGTDSAQRVEKHRADLSGAPGMEVVASTGEYKPGEKLARHFHHGVEAAYVVQGATIQVPGKDPMTIPAGASLLNLRDIRHGGFEVVGDTTLRLFTVHIVDKGKPLYDYTP